MLHRPHPLDPAQVDNIISTNTIQLENCISSIQTMLISYGIDISNSDDWIPVVEYLQKSHHRGSYEKSLATKENDYQNLLVPVLYRIFKNKSKEEQQALFDIPDIMIKKHSIEDIDEDPYLSGVIDVIEETRAKLKRPWYKKIFDL
jgi:hypothetical protein